MALDDLWNGMHSLPDHAQLAGRIYLCDGAGRNVVLDTQDVTRPVGALGQQTPLAVADAAGGGSLTGGDIYTWGVQRVISDGMLLVESPVALATHTLAANKTAATLTLTEYEDLDALPTGWSVTYRIFRSQANTPMALLWVTDLTSFAATYTDTKADNALSETYTFQVDSTELNVPFPPAKFVRAYQGRLVYAGALTLAVELATTASSAVVTPAGVVVKPQDVGAAVLIDGETGGRSIIGADVANGTWELSHACANTAAAAAAKMRHPDDVVYVGNPLPGNIEGYPFGTEVYSNSGSGNRVMGLAEAGGYLYVLREQRPEILELDVDQEVASGSNNLTPLSTAAPGPVSAATIADRSGAAVFWYAGRAGVWMLSGTEAERISDPIQEILDTQVLHAWDAFTHGVLDPRTMLYHVWVFQAGDVALDEAGVVTYRIPSLVLTYDTRRKQWTTGTLPASRSGVWRNSTGQAAAVIGIKGGVAALDSGTTDGGVLLTGDVESGSTTTLTCSGAFYNQLLTGLRVHCVHAATGAVESRVIQSHTDDVLTVAPAWASAPASGDQWEIGTIDWEIETGDLTMTSDPTAIGRASQVTVVFDPPASSEPVQVQVVGSGAREGAATTRATSIGGTDACDAVVLGGSAQGLRSRGMRVAVSGRGRSGTGVLAVVLQAEQARGPR